MGQPGIQQVIKILAIGLDAITTRHGCWIDVVSLVEIEFDILACLLEGIVHEFKMLGFNVVIIQAVNQEGTGLEFFRMQGIIPFLPDIAVIALMRILILVELVDVVGIILPNACPVSFIQDPSPYVERQPR